MSRRQATAEAVRLDCAKAQIKSETAESCVAEVLSCEGELRSELAAVRKDLVAVQQARSEAERRADVAEAHLAYANKTNARAENYFSEFRTAVKRLERTPEPAAAAEASVVELRAQVAMLKELLAKALVPQPEHLRGEPKLAQVVVSGEPLHQGRRRRGRTRASAAFEPGKEAS